MDPQKLSQLDPKLREAYQRVMGTTIPEPQVAPVQAQTPPTTPPMPYPTPAPMPQPEPEPAPMPTPTIEEPPTTSEPQSIPTPQPTIPEPQPAIPQPQPPIPEPTSTPEPVIPQPAAQANNFVQMNSEVATAPTSANFSAPASTPQAQTMTIKKKSGMMPILIVAASLFFLMVYFLFWTKIFNFKLPFLPF